MSYISSLDQLYALSVFGMYWKRGIRTNQTPISLLVAMIVLQIPKDSYSEDAVGGSKITSVIHSLAVFLCFLCSIVSPNLWTASYAVVPNSTSIVRLLTSYYTEPTLLPYKFKNDAPSDKITEEESLAADLHSTL